MKRTSARFLIAAALALAIATRVAAEADREKRAPVWVYLETVPGSATEADLKERTPPIGELDRVARFVMGGIVYGWKFSYTPSDKKREVNERFSLEPIMEIGKGDGRFAMTEIVPDYPRLTCWAVFVPGDAEKRREEYWKSVTIKSASGHGTGERIHEADGVLAAYGNAIKAAVRSRAQALEKNKPKEIRGEALLRDMPRLRADEGYFVADVKVLVNILETVPYATH